MARKLDHMSDRIARFHNMRADLSKAEKEARALREDMEKEQAAIIKLMGASTEATIGDQVVFEVKDTMRRATSIELVKEHAPQLADKLIKVTHGKKINFV